MVPNVCFLISGLGEKYIVTATHIHIFIKKCFKKNVFLYICCCDSSSIHGNVGNVVVVVVGHCCLTCGNEFVVDIQCLLLINEIVFMVILNNA